MARLRATFVDSMDGWVDDSLAFGQDWDFDPSRITAPVGIWHGTSDTTVPSDHAEWLLTHIPAAGGHTYAGGHVPGPEVYLQIYDWLVGDSRPSAYAPKSDPPR
jgi:pimeloyl-ACP methyl ester carboxylesterase